MFDEIDRRYYEQRARESREREQVARDTSIARVHRRFAEDYERKVLTLSKAPRPG